WLASGCVLDADSASTDDLGVSRAAVVEGRGEPDYEAVGYLMKGSSRDDMRGPYCGITLVAPQVAVTVAHCLDDDEPGTWIGVGFGDVYSSPAVIASAVHLHPSHRATGPTRYHHDVAVLVLEAPVEDRVPARILPPIVDPAWDAWRPES